MTKTSQNINRRMNKLKKHSAKEKSIILTLTFIIIMFTLGNIPSAIFAIMTRPEFRSKDWFVVRQEIFLLHT